MAAHRYWRATAFEAYGAGDLELSEFHLLAGGARVDTPATLTASVAPDVSGSLANLQDDVLSTAARWSAQAVKGLTLQWDFGGATADIGSIRLAGGCEARFPLIVKIQRSDDAASWTTLVTYSGIKWPGTAALGAGGADGDPLFSSVISLLNMNGVDGSTTFPDAKGLAYSSYGGAVVSTTTSKFGGSSAYFNGGGAFLQAFSSTFNVTASGFTVEAWVYPTANPTTIATMIHVNVGSNHGLHIYRNPAGNLAVDNGLVGTTAGAIPMPLNTWSHFAVVVNAGVLKGYVNGVECLSHAAQDYGTPNQISVGRLTSAYGTYFYYTGFIAELRISAMARYTSAFSPPEAAFLGSAGSGITNTVAGRSSPGDVLSLGYGAIITYGTPQIALPDYLSIESGSVKDQITGVLGEGIGRVKGTVTTKGSPNQPVHRKVRLIRERDGVVIREVWSNAATGEYDFQYVDEAQRYTVVSYDHLHNYRAVIADNLTPELMP